MKPKTIITIVLLLFIAASVGFMIAKGIQPAGEKSADDVAPQNPAAASQNPNPPTQNAAPALQNPASENSPQIIVYYFHGSARCPTCRKFEAYTQEAIQSGFAKEVQSGRLELKVINRDAPENQHFIQDFQLAANSVVIERVLNGSQIRWKNLDKIWDLVKEEQTFVNYIQNEIAAYLADS